MKFYEPKKPIPAPLQNEDAVANESDLSNGPQLDPPGFNVSAQAPAQFFMGNWLLENIIPFGPSSGDKAQIETWLQMDSMEVVHELNDFQDLPALSKLYEATASFSFKQTKKLSKLRTLIGGRLQSLKALKANGATDEQLEQIQKPSADASWKTNGNVSVKYIDGKGMLGDQKLKTKIRSVKEDAKLGDRGSTAYQLYLPYNFGFHKGWYFNLLNPVLMIDIRVAPLKEFAKLSDLGHLYEEYQDMVSANDGDKDKALDQFIKKHTSTSGHVTADFTGTQSSTLYHESGHVHELQESYEALLPGFLNSMSSKLSKVKHNESPDADIRQYIYDFWGDFYGMDHKGEHHKEIVARQIAAMIALLEGQTEQEAFQNDPIYDEVKNKMAKSKK